MNRLLTRLLTLFLCAAAANPQDVFTTIAGKNWSFQDFGRPATEAALSNNLYGIAADSSGKIYITDGNTSTVFTVNSGSVLELAAGNGFPNFSGDGGAARNASLNSPWGVYADSNGNLWICDTFNHRVRRVSVGGTISTVAGNGNQGSQGDGGPAVNASLVWPRDLVLDHDGNVYLTDYFGYRVRRIDPNGNISAFIGSGQYGNPAPGSSAAQSPMTTPTGLAIDSEGTIYVADERSNRVLAVRKDGILRLIAGDGNASFGGDGGPATQASLNAPGGVFVDNSGNVYIADTGNNRVRKVDPNGVISTVAGNGIGAFGGDGGPATQASLQKPTNVLLYGAILYIVDANNYRVRRVDGAGIISTFAGNGLYRYSPEGAAPEQTILHSPQGLSFDHNGDLLIADTANNRVRKISNGAVTTVAGTGGDGFAGDKGPATQAVTRDIRYIAECPNRNIYFSDSSNERIRVITPDGRIDTYAGTGALQNGQWRAWPLMSFVS